MSMGDARLPEAAPERTTSFEIPEAYLQHIIHPKRFTERVVKAWSEGARYYHTLDGHLKEMTNLFMRYGARYAHNPLHLWLAIVFHDARLFCPYAERESANFMRDTCLDTVLFHDQSLDSVEQLIRLTAFHTTDLNLGSMAKNWGAIGRDARLLMDFDLYGLGKTWEEYMENSRNVCREWEYTAGGMPDKYFVIQFAGARKALFLEPMLARKALYYTGLFGEEWETRARENLAREVELLEKGGAWEMYRGED